MEETPIRLVLSGGKVWQTAGSAVALGVLGLLLIMLPGGFGLRTGLGVAIGIILLGVAGGIMASVQIVTWTFDKKRGTLETLREGLISADRQQFHLSEIRAVEIEASSQKPDKFRLIVRHKSGQLSPLLPHYPLSQSRATYLVEKINTFLMRR